MPTTPRLTVAVDRFEGSTVVLVQDDGTMHQVSRSDLPGKVNEGTILRVPLTAGKQPDWSHATIDDKERRRRLDQARKTLDELRKRDPGGDLTL